MVERRKFPHVTQYCARVLTVLAQLFLGFALFSSPVFSQTLTVEPGCGVAGSTVKIGGSGWAEPQPPCDYLFYFDGVEFAPRQPDGLFGPPNRTATIPASATPGDHKIKVELRLRPQIGTLLQCRQTTFKVVTAIENPFKGTNIKPAVGGTDATGAVDLTFDPTNVCDVTPCTKLVWIQALKQVGVRADGTTQTLTYANFGFPNAATFDNDTVPATGVGVDLVFGSADAYYTTLGAGHTGSTPSGTVNLFDQPRESTFPASSTASPINTIRFEFESNVFCAEGQNKGTFPGGKVVWTWEKNSGSAGNLGTSKVVSATRDQPSAQFLGGVARWDANHNTWAMPTATPPTTGGEACN